MGLSRLDNFIKSIRGNIIYVDPNSLDATDSIQNQGNSLTRPFLSIQRASIEAARFSYQSGLNNDRFAKTTIIVFPGDHVIDNRPGWIPDGTNNFRLRNGQTSSNFPELSSISSFDLSDSNNQLYKFNSIFGGMIIPRGTSIVGVDLRKTKIRPLYVPSPTNNNIERSCIFRVTGGSYFWQFSVFDADPNKQCFIDYTDNTFIPNFSHHKLTCFEYADGINPVVISDTFQSYSTDRTDLDMYYEKIGLAYGASSGRAINPDYPSVEIDIQPKIDEYRIVGSTGESVGISSIRSGNGVTSTNIITVTTTTTVPGLDVDTSFKIEGIAEYNGQFVVKEKLSDVEIQYQVQNPPSNPLPSVVNASLSLTRDTVTSASPYIFNVSLRSVYGMCGLLADGNKATGFKSMMVAQFTGIGLQKDNNAFVLYDSISGTYQDTTIPGNDSLSENSRSIFKPEYRNFHIKAINDAFIQNVSVFAIGYAEQFVVENGGDMSITNSNSNFGSKALVASGFRENSFPQDDKGYITHIIPPKEFSKEETTVEFDAIDVNVTVGVASTGHLYLYNQTNKDIPPENVIEGYRIGARENDELKVLISTGGSFSEYSAKIVMPNTQTSSEKSFDVGRSNVGINSITGNVITLNSTHTFQNGESVRVLSENGQLPDGLIPNNVYYAITNGIGSNQVKIAKTQNDAISLNPVTINNKGGRLSIVSRVSDKNPGDIGHPIQFDESQGHWYIKVAVASTENNIYSTLLNLGSSVIGDATSRTYVNRLVDDRNSIDTLYRLRYVIPSTSDARPPSDGYVFQESNTTIGATNAEVQTYFGSGSISSIGELRNPKFISNAVWNSNTATITSEIPHNLSVGSEIEIINVRSSNNSSATADIGFNGKFVITSIGNSKEFSYILTSNPGTFTSDTSARTTELPYFKRKKFNNTYYVFRSEEVQEHILGEQDGIYYITLINASNTPTISPFENEKFTQSIKELYPQVNRDNPEADPEETKSFASSSLIGEVVVNDVRNSITKEALNKTFKDSHIGIGITDIHSSSTTNHTIFTSHDHGLNRITKVSISNPGVGYGLGSSGDYYNATLVGFAGSTVGQYATAKVTLDGAGTITNIKIMDGGSSYGIGNTLTVTGIGTTTGFSPAVITVNNVYNNIGDVVKISGITSTRHKDYNNLYRITGINVGSAKSFSAVSATPVSAVSNKIGSEVVSNSILYLTGEAIRVNTFTYNNVTGIATVTTFNRHGLQVDNKIRITGSNETLYNGEFIVTKNNGPTSFDVKVGVSTNAPPATGTLFVYRGGFTSNEGVISKNNENLNGRMIPIYAGITTTLSASISNATTDEINILNSTNLDINIGDYLLIDDEIVRVKTNTSTTPSPIFVFRGVLGTLATNHDNNTTVRKIRVEPIELRRHSIIRASSHTFEYVGYGPGNYSTAFPDKQDRQISSTEELLAQSTRKNGGVNFFTGMNDKGVSYAGNKKLSTITGQEEIFDTPIQTVTGEDIGNLRGINVITPDEANFSRSISVDGGVDRKSLSTFNGPVLLTNKVISNSASGVEAVSLFLQGDVSVSRKITVGIATPSLVGNPGDIVYNAEPNSGGNVGWVYTKNNIWESFGQISTNNVPAANVVDVRSNSTLLGASKAINFVGTGGITVSGVYNSSLGISTLTFNATITNPSQLVVSGISTFNGQTFFNSISTFNNTINAGTINASSLSATNVSFTNLNGPSIGISTFTATNSNFSGNIILGTISKASDTFVRVLAGDNNKAGFEAYGNSQGTGYLYVGEDSNDGGGIVYNGDGTPAFATGETADTIAFYRKNSGANEVVFSYPNNSNNVTFRGSVSASSFTSSGELSVTGNINATGIITASSFTSSGGLSVVNNNQSQIEIKSYFNGSNHSIINLYGSRGTQSSPSIVNYQDDVGSINYYGYNGSSFSEIGNIKFKVDGVPPATPTSGNVPGQYQLSLRDDTNTVVPRHRIDLYGANAFYADDSVIFSKTNNSAGTSVATFVGQHSSTGFTSGTNSCLIYSNGNIYNTNNVYSVISDIKLKENIEPAKSQWDDIKNLRVVNFNFKEETGQQTNRQIGLIAQEVEKVSPGLVETVDNFYDDPMKGVKTSIIHMKALKALQEAMQRIEQLEERLNAAGIPLN